MAALQSFLTLELPLCAAVKNHTIKHDLHSSFRVSRPPFCQHSPLGLWLLGATSRLHPRCSYRGLSFTLFRYPSICYALGVACGSIDAVAYICGRRGIRTPEAFLPLASLAVRCFRPLSHPSGSNLFSRTGYKEF